MNDMQGHFQIGGSQGQNAEHHHYQPSLMTNNERAFLIQQQINANANNSGEGEPSGFGISHPPLGQRQSIYDSSISDPFLVSSSPV
jgi:hypothetical protein